MDRVRQEGFIGPAFYKLREETLVIYALGLLPFIPLFSHFALKRTGLCLAASLEKSATEFSRVIHMGFDVLVDQVQGALKFPLQAKLVHSVVCLLLLEDIEEAHIPPDLSGTFLPILSWMNHFLPLHCLANMTANSPSAGWPLLATLFARKYGFYVIRILPVVATAFIAIPQSSICAGRIYPLNSTEATIRINLGVVETSVPFPSLLRQ
jgi:hypothetical protein